MSERSTASPPAARHVDMRPGCPPGQVQANSAIDAIIHDNVTKNFWLKMMLIGNGSLVLRGPWYSATLRRRLRCLLGSLIHLILWDRFSIAECPVVTG
jgi:hypothetical protein